MKKNIKTTHTSNFWHYVRVTIFVLYAVGSAPTILIGALKTVTSLGVFDIAGVKTNLCSLAVPVVGMVILYILFFYAPSRKKANQTR